MTALDVYVAWKILRVVVVWDLDRGLAGEDAPRCAIMSLKSFEVLRAWA
jgi:hypothetical protein